jgi:tetratricopeptide (TPR) repeat protein/tRNA A-37 threonylcarbamoyl transferase component Bud32
MSIFLNCPRGHRWEPSIQANTLPTYAPLTCPVCGVLCAPPSEQLSASHETRADPCPTPETLLQLLAGALSETLAGQVHAHLEACRHCQAVLDKATDRPSLRQWLAPTRLQKGESEDPRHTVAYPGGSAACPPAVAIPSYEILGELGRGGMGVVYRARHLQLNRVVALKMLREVALDSPQLQARFQIEAEAVASLQHPNVVQIYEVGESGGCPFLAMEFVEGGSLQDRLRSSLPSPHEAAEIVQALAGAAHSAHQRGIIHRDLKPANVLLTQTGVPKLTDFGLAKRFGEKDGQTQTGAIVGTPSYMAPEQAFARTGAIGPPADVYALGAVLYACLTGHPPFEAPTILEILEDVRSREPVPPARLRPGVPRDLETICLKCLHKEPARRYASAEKLSEDLRRFLCREPIKARPVGPLERLRLWAKRRPSAAALVLVLFLAAVGTVAGVVRYQVRLQVERSAAEKSFRMALRAVDKMLSEVAEEELAAEPRSEQKRRRLLSQTLAFYQELLQDRGGDPVVRQETGRAYRRLGDILRLLGQNAEAQDAYQQAIGVLSDLAAKSPSAPEPRADLAESHNWLGELLRTTGRSDDARAAYQNAQRLQDELIARYPDVPGYRMGLARTHYNRGILLKDKGAFADARGEFRQAIDTLCELVGEYPDQSEYRQHLARSYLNLGPVLRQLRESAAAESVYTEAIRQFRTLNEKDPYKPDYRHELGAACNNLGNLLAVTGRAKEAQSCHGEAVELFGKLVAEHPDVPVYRIELANSRNSLGAVLAGGKDWAGARREWDLARGLLQELVTRSPDVATYQADLGRTLGNLGRLHLLQNQIPDACRLLAESVRQFEAALRLNPDSADDWKTLRGRCRDLADALVRNGAHAEARGQAESLSRSLPGGRGYYLAACFLARCVTALEQQLAPPKDQKSTLIQPYVDQARNLVEEGLRRGDVDLTRLKGDRDFLPLGEREDFVRLLNSRTGPGGR